MSKDFIRDAFRYHRRISQTPRAWPTCSATTALNCARRDLANYQAAMAEGDTKAAARFKRYPASDYGAVTWQDRETSGSPAKLARRLAFVEKPERVGLRHVGNVEAESYGGRDCFSRRDSGGWYTDPAGDVFKDGSGLAWGVVYQLPGRKGMARFVAGYVIGGCGDNNPTLDFGTIYECSTRDHWSGGYSRDEIDAARDAARAADQMAKHAAESEREYKAAWQAGNRYSDLGDEIAQSRAEIKESISLFRQLRRDLGAAAVDTSKYGKLCAIIRGDVAGERASIDKARQERRKLAEGDYIAEWLPGFYTGDSHMRDAFNEGAGATVLS